MDFRTFYDAYWAAKDDAFDPYRLALLTDRVPSGVWLLEVGCGPGILGKLLKEKDVHVVGTDLSPVAIERAKGKGIHGVRCDPDVQPLPFKAASFPYAASNSSLEHLFDPQKALREIHRILEPKGVFLWMVPNVGHWHFRWWLLCGRFPVVSDSATDPLHIRMYTRGEAVCALRACGFRIVRVTGSAGTWVPRLYPWWLRAPVIRHLYERAAPWWPSLLCRYLLLEAEKTGDE